jgi:hypothetical protein
MFTLGGMLGVSWSETVQKWRLLATSWPKNNTTTPKLGWQSKKRQIPSDRNTLHNPTNASPIKFMFTLGGMVGVSWRGTVQKWRLLGTSWPKFNTTAPKVRMAKQNRQFEVIEILCIIQPRKAPSRLCSPWGAWWLLHEAQQSRNEDC